MNIQEAEKQMQEVVDNSGDIESDHGKADAILCEFLESLGYKNLVEIYERIDKWYA